MTSIGCVSGSDGDCDNIDVSGIRVVTRSLSFGSSVFGIGDVLRSTFIGKVVISVSGIFEAAFFGSSGFVIEAAVGSDGVVDLADVIGIVVNGIVENGELVTLRALATALINGYFPCPQKLPEKSSSAIVRNMAPASSLPGMGKEFISVACLKRINFIRIKLSK